MLLFYQLMFLVVMTLRRVQVSVGTVVGLVLIVVALISVQRYYKRKRHLYYGFKSICNHI